MEYKQVRLRADYVIKLKKIADNTKRSMSKTLEILIDEVTEPKEFKHYLKKNK